MKMIFEKNPLLLETDQYLLGGWDRCIFNFQCEKKPMSYLERKLTKNTILSVFCDYLSKKKYVSYRFLHRSQPPNEYWPVPKYVDKYVATHFTTPVIMSKMLLPIMTHQMILITHHSNVEGWQYAPLMYLPDITKPPIITVYRQIFQGDVF